MATRGLVLQYFKDSILCYWSNCVDYVWELEVKEVIDMSFKHKPSLTYLDLSYGTFSSCTRLPNCIESLRCKLDVRKETIKRLDLEDKNQWAQCSKFCYQPHNYPARQNWTLDYDGFPGYIRVHDVDTPKDYDFDFLNVRCKLYRAIIDFVSESSSVHSTIVKFLPSIRLMQDWMGGDAVLMVYTSFLELLYRARSRDLTLIGTVLNYCKPLNYSLWEYVEDEVVDWLLSIGLDVNYSSSEWYYKGTMGATISNILTDTCLFKSFLLYGLYPVKEKVLTINRNSKGLEEELFNDEYYLFIRRCLPEDLFRKRRHSISTELTNIDLLCIIAIGAYKMKGDAELKEVLIMIWKCIYNAHLGFEDFAQLFEQLTTAEIWKLEIIYFWYRKAIGANFTYGRSPRTLQQYCRCSVRNSLVAASMLLPNTIQKLPLPERLKSYLILKL